MDLNLSLTLPEDYTHLPMVRRVAREVLRSFAVGDQDIDDIELLVGELATNAVRHARSGEGFRLAIALDGDRVAVTVIDSGKGFERSRLAPPGTARGDGADGDGAPERIGGWGLPLVERIADEVEIAPNVPSGTRVRAVKFLQMGDARKRNV